MHAPALILCVLTFGLQRGGADCSPRVSLIPKIFWNPPLFLTDVVFLNVCDCGFDCVLICILILGECKKYSPVKYNFLEGEFYISNEVKTDRPDSQNNTTGYAVGWRYLRPMPQIENAIWKLWQEWQCPVLSESCETKLFQHFQGQKDHYFLILRIQRERIGENYTPTTLARTRHMSSSIFQAGSFWKKTEPSCFSLKQNMWIRSPSRLGWPRYLLILSICNPQLQCGQVDLAGEPIHQGQICGLTQPYVYP